MPSPKSFLKGSTPPFLWSAAKSLARAVGLIKDEKPEDPDALFDGDDVLFKEAIGTAQVYGEYGVGASTIWVARHSNIPMISVDSSNEWLTQVRQEIPESNWIMKHVDLGPLANWGFPKTHSRRENYRCYPTALWQSERVPDLVLVDGRFRVTCFLTCLLEARPGTKIIFDDYMNRPKYHLVEEFCEASKTSVRQALFVVPETLDRPNIEKTRDDFAMVTD